MAGRYNQRVSTTTPDECFVMSNPASSPLRRGVEQILATADHTTLVVKATKDGRLGSPHYRIA